MKRRTWFVVLAVFIALHLEAQPSELAYRNNVSINLLAIPVGNSVIAYEYYFNRQSLWFGGEHHFNGIFKEENKSLNSIALEYRRYFLKSLEVADGLFVGLYSKYRTGQEALIEDAEFSHSYHAIFTGLNAGYQYFVNRFVFSAFAGYGIPVYIAEEGVTSNGETELNKGYNRDVRFGLTVGFAF